MGDDHEIRHEAINRIRASLPFLATAPLQDVARELIVQGLDLVERSARAAVFAEACAQLDKESR